MERINSSNDGRTLLTWIANLVGPGEHFPVDRRDNVGPNEEAHAGMQDERRVYELCKESCLNPRNEQGQSSPHYNTDLSTSTDTFNSLQYAQ